MTKEENTYDDEFEEDDYFYDENPYETDGLSQSEINELHRGALTELLAEYKFEELSETKTSTTDNEEIIIKTINKGVFKGDNGRFGIFCNFIDKTSLPAHLQNYFANKQEVVNIYEGNKYLLCSTKESYYVFSIEDYRQLCEIVDEVEYNLELGEINYRIGINKDSTAPILSLETNVASFVIMGQIDNDQLEEERTILSQFLEKSKPFFEFEKPQYFNWENLKGHKDSQFERICEALLNKQKNITTIISIGKTRAADRGRDFEVTEVINEFGNRKEIKWLVQCKYSEKSISPNSIAGWTDRIIEHKYDGFWLMTNNDITPSLFDQFKDVDSNVKFGFKVKFWQRSDFDVKLNVYSELFTNGNYFKDEE